MSQTLDILDALQEGMRIGPYTALDLFGCFRLSARIGELRKLGHDIKKDMIESNGKRFACYYLEGK